MMFRQMVDSVLRRNSTATPEDQERGHAIIKRVRDLLDQTHQEQTAFSEKTRIDPGKSLRSGCEGESE